VEVEEGVFVPYIDKDSRSHLDRRLAPVSELLKAMGVAEKPGLLNYALTKLVLTSLPLDTYAQLSVAHSQLTMAAAELYRRRIAAYEDVKIKEAGDVY
jgi:hypothetical protein